MSNFIPLYRAKKIDSDEYATGFIFQDFYSFKWFIHDSVQTDEIDGSAVEMSFDGKKFYFAEAVEYLIMLAQNTPSSELQKLLETKSAGIQK